MVTMSEAGVFSILDEICVGAPMSNKVGGFRESR
jgi:hypothetical protein